MTTRPCRPKRILEVDLGYPRRHELVTGRRYRELVLETTEVVHEEALKSFQLGEKEG